MTGRRSACFVYCTFDGGRLVPFNLHGPKK